jgi:hypothetical protein
VAGFGLGPTLIDVDTWTLDDVLAGRRADVVKIDVEGAELEVLRGAAKTLAQGPTVVIEHGARPMDEHAEMFDLLTDAGLRLFTIDGDGPFLTDDSFAARSDVGDLWTWVAHR